MREWTRIVARVALFADSRIVRSCMGLVQEGAPLEAKELGCIQRRAVSLDQGGEQGENPDRRPIFAQTELAAARALCCL